MFGNDRGAPFLSCFEQIWKRITGLFGAFANSFLHRSPCNLLYSTVQFSVNLAVRRVVFEFDRGYVKTRTTCDVGSIARDSSQQSRVQLSLRARECTASSVAQGFLNTLGREATVALEVVGELETHQPTASPSFLKSDPDR
jgi:hypothetical protein